MKSIRKVLLLALLGTGTVLSAHAADLAEPPFEEMPLVPVEVGSGWYLRGDVSYDFKSDLDSKFHGSFQDEFGVVTDDRGHYDAFNLDDNVDYSLGFGYQFTDYFRGDLIAHYWQSNLQIDGSDFDKSACGLAGDADYTCSHDDDRDVSAWELMANAYIDLGTFAGVTPYVGGGAGAVHVKYDDLKIDAQCNAGGLACGDTTVDFDGGSDWRFAYALTAGASYDLTQSLKLDVGYRYLNVDGGDLFEANVTGASLKLEDKGFDRHTIQAGLRYSLF